MKKFIALTIGLSLLGAALIVPMSSASREAYHSYISQKIKESGRYRHYAFRRGNQKTILFPRKNVVRRDVALHLHRNYLIPRIGKRNLHRTNVSNRNLKLRTSTNRVLGMNVVAKNSHRQAVPVAKNTLLKSDFVNYNNEIYSLEIPANSIVNDQDGTLNSELPLSSVKFLAKKLDNKCSENFELCARAISRTRDYQGDIYRTSKSVRQYQKTDIVLGEIGLNSKKFVEGFVGVKEGKYSFIARFVVAGEDGDVFLVEVKSDLNDIDQAVAIAKRLFASFRAKY